MTLLVLLLIFLLIIPWRRLTSSFVLFPSFSLFTSSVRLYLSSSSKPAHPPLLVLLRGQLAIVLVI